MSVSYDPCDLPESMSEIAELLGFDYVVILMEIFGGSTLYVPKVIHEDHRISQLLGEDAAKKLEKHFGGQWLQIPRGTRMKIQARNRQIIEARNAQMPVSVLARKFELTERHIWLILHDLKEELQLA